METLFDAVSRRSDRRPWTRQDSVNKCKAEREQGQLRDRYTGKISPCKKFAVAKREGKFFRIAGMGIVRVKTFAALKVRAQKFGFTDIRFGAIRQSLI